MFGIFKKKTEKEKLIDLYKKTKAEAYKFSRIDRRKSDEKEMEASKILQALDKLEETKE